MFKVLLEKDKEVVTLVSGGYKNIIKIRVMHKNCSRVTFTKLWPLR